MHLKYSFFFLRYLQNKTKQNKKIYSKDTKIFCILVFILLIFIRTKANSVNMHVILWKLDSILPKCHVCLCLCVFCFVICQKENHDCLPSKKKPIVNIKTNCFSLFVVLLTNCCKNKKKHQTLQIFNQNHIFLCFFL